MAKHSKWPFFLRMHGSVLPKMIIPLTVITIWSTAITLISEHFYKLKVSNLLLTVLGFVVGLAISFRTSSAYERVSHPILDYPGPSHHRFERSQLTCSKYTEGRKYWSQLQLVSQNLARTIWIHASEREGELGKEDLLAKLYVIQLGHDQNSNTNRQTTALLLTFSMLSRFL
jgi:putative membrane protein